MSTNLEYYRKQAKALLKSARAGDSSAVGRIQRYSPSLALSAAQLAIAREQGFSSWPAFKLFLVQSHFEGEGLISAFIEAAMSDVRRAGDLLSKHPDLARAGAHAALVLGDVERVRSVLQGDPEFARAKGGPSAAEPLIYVCFSRYGHPLSPRSAGLVETASLLLERGADPNTAFDDPRWPQNPLPCLYGATGVNNNPALAKVLLEAGLTQTTANRSTTRPSTGTSSACAFSSRTALAWTTRTCCITCSIVRMVRACGC